MSSHQEKELYSAIKQIQKLLRQARQNQIITGRNVIHYSSYEEDYGLRGLVGEIENIILETTHNYEQSKRNKNDR